MNLLLLFQFARVGVYGTEVTPVPIPNTEVKLCREDDTWLATARKIISMPAQLNGSRFDFRLFILSSIANANKIGKCILRAISSVG